MSINQLPHPNVFRDTTEPFSLSLPNTQTLVRYLHHLSKINRLTSRKTYRGAAGGKQTLGRRTS
ncbi:hypothetical protein E2C01_074115 [Portunus trituberculatus]|uniref:Uncharacterized protein n=1 Tax=Portunus trituberculatus TaxID=210409 RepID=A0A5B7I4R3_PORTR|nr:hypothetical protein [Portunus trituberculatus]